MGRIVPLLAALIAGSAAAAPSAPDVAAQVQRYYAGIAHLRAHFRQEFVNTTFGTTRTSQGTVTLARPRQMRWDYASAKDPTRVAKSFVSDGKTLWIVEHDNLQVIVRSVAGETLPASAAFLIGGDLTKDYTIAFDATGTYGGKGAVVLALTPTTPQAQVKTLALVVDPSDGHVAESIVIAPGGDVNHFVFDAPDTKTAPAASLFTVDTKALAKQRYRVVTP